MKDSPVAETISTVHKKIELRDQKTTEAKKIAEQFDISLVAAKVVAARGFKADDDLSNFLNPTLKSSLPDVKELKNVDLGCKLVKEASERGEAVAICCDFDVDGLSGGSQMLHFLTECGMNAHVFVPDRFTEGYGLNEEMIRRAAAGGYKLLITIDFGTTNIKELELARKLGLKTVVIDHHHVAEIPPTDCFINPNQAGCGFANKILCASGLTWYFIAALRKHLKQAEAIDVRDYLDLACLGTICDMVPLVGANRVIAKRGLELLAKSTRPGLIALKNVSSVNQKVTCHHVSFGIGPRLNAAGRLVHGETVIELLTTKDSNLARKIAGKLDRLNTDRKEIEDRIKEQAIKQMREKHPTLPSAIVVWGEDYHTGVIGLVAQRLVEGFYRPSAVMGIDQDGVYKGSVRGIRGFNVVETLSKLKDILIKYGGHEGAGGFAVKAENLERFAEAFRKECAKKLESIATEPSVLADTAVSFSDLTYDVIEELRSFAPFGVGNSAPQLLAKQVTVREVRVLKGDHLKVGLSDGQRFISGLFWRQRSHPALAVGNKVDVVFKPETNSYNGSLEVQANIQAIESSS